MLAGIIRETRARRPLVHCITNYVTANDCANLLLACGASPIMAEDPLEVEEVTSLCASLVLNLGTPSPQKISAMERAGKAANRLRHPVVFDPVGVGSSQMRMAAASRLLNEVKLSVIRGNAGEISTLLRGVPGTRGVDSDGEAVLADCLGLARKTGAAIICTGAADLVCDSQTAYRVHGGHPMMKSVTGTGCQLSALTGAYAACGAPLNAALAAACAMALCGETAYAHLQPHQGNASYRNAIIDAMYHLKPEALEEARYEILK